MVSISGSYFVGIDYFFSASRTMIFASSIQWSAMPEKNEDPADPENETCPADSENSIENIKYIKKLALQRSVLNKLVASDLNHTTTNISVDPESPDPNKSVKNKSVK